VVPSLACPRAPGRAAGRVLGAEDYLLPHLCQQARRQRISQILEDQHAPQMGHQEIEQLKLLARNIPLPLDQESESATGPSFFLTEEVEYGRVTACTLSSSSFITAPSLARAGRQFSSFRVYDLRFICRWAMEIT
jgi:hypothetical protein